MSHSLLLFGSVFALVAIWRLAPFVAAFGRGRPLHRRLHHGLEQLLAGDILTGAVKQISLLSCDRRKLIRGESRLIVEGLLVLRPILMPNGDRRRLGRA